MSLLSTMKLRDALIDPFTRSRIARWAPIPLRLIVGYGFMEHGFAKLSKGPDAFTAILQALAVPMPHFMTWVTIVTELLGGLAILLGAFVSLVSFADGGAFVGSYLYGASSLWVQFDQANCRHSIGGTVWAGGL